jgi:Flp pilus assembly protein TadD
MAPRGAAFQKFQGLLVVASAMAFVFGGAALRAQATTPQSADARFSEASRALSAGEAERAIQLATDYLKQHPSSARARILLARAHISRDDFDAAYRELRHVARTQPRNVDALYYLGLVSARLAELEFKKLSELAPNSARLHQLQAEALEIQDRRAVAEEAYEAALAVDPNLLDALLALGKLKRIRLACEDAVRLYERAEAIRHTYDGAYGLGVCLGSLDRDEEAAVQFRRAIRHDPRAALAWVGLGASLNKLGRSKEAIDTLQRAIALEPRMGQAYYALGLAYRTAGQTELARQAFRQAQQFGGAMGPGSEPAASGRPPE